MMKFTFKKAKEKYESIMAPDNLKMEVNNMFKRKNNVLKYVSSSAAAVVVAFTVALNVSPVFASSVASNKIMRPLVTILTTNRYEFKDNNMEANVTIPIIKGINNEKVEKTLNEEIEKMSQQLIKDFENESKELKKISNDAHIGLESNYIVKTNNDDVLSIDLYVTNIAGSSSTVHKFYNINKKTGNVITLKDKFENDDNYLTTISKYISNEMNRQNLENGSELYFATYDEVYNLVSEKQPFYINEKGNVVIVFDKYEVGPGSTGCPEFEIKQ